MNPCFIKPRVFCAALFLLFSVASSVHAQVQTARTNTPIGTNSNGFYEYLPQGYNPNGSTRYPLLIFVHGFKEYGNGSASEITRVLRHGPAKVINAGTFPVSFTVNGKTFKFIVLCPQFKSGVSAAHIGSVIDYALAHYKVDPKRVYLTGLSAGGCTVEATAGDATVGKRIAAIVEFAGTSTPTMAKATAIVNNKVAFWGFHNMYDRTVSSSKTINYVNYILAVDPTAPAKKTIGGLGGSTSHDCWSNKFPATWKENGLSIYEWMLQFERGTVTTSSNTAPVANAGSDKNITLPTTSVTLSGSGTDANGTISRYKWTKVSGPTGYTFNSTSVAAPTVTGLAVGTYVFRLTVTDNGGATDYDDVKVVVNAAPVTTFAVPGKVEAEDYSAMSGIAAQPTSDAGGGENVGYFDQGDWLEYKVKTTTAGTYAVTFRVASPESGAKLQLKNSGGTVLATATVPNTGGWQTWRNVTANVNLAAGTQTIRLYSAAASGWNINYLTFVSGVNGAPEPAITKIEAEDYTTMSGIATQPTTDAGGGENVGYIDQGNWMKYRINATAAGAHSFAFRIASPNSGGQFKVYNAAGTTLATVTVPNTGGWQNWKTVSATITLPAGSQELKITSTAVPHWNINYFTLGLAVGTASALAAATDVAEEATQASGLSITPNPLADRFMLSVNNNLTGLMRVQLIDAGGAVRQELQVQKKAVGALQTYLSAGRLPAGTYFISAQMGAWRQSKQVVKL